MAEKGALSRVKDSQLLLPVLIVLIGAAIRLVGLPHVGCLSFDEAWSLRITQKDIATAFEIVSYDKHPPLFYALLYGWVRLAGTEEFSLRLPSALCGIANIAILYNLGRRLFDHKAGLIAAAFIAVNPLHLWFSQEARMYQITVMFSLLSTICLWRAREQSNWKHWGCYLVSTLSLVLTHYIAGLLIVGQGIFLLLDVLRHRERWHIFRTWLLILGAAFLVCVPWIPRFIAQIKIDAGPPPWIATMLGSPSPAALILTFLRDFTLGFPDMYARGIRWATYVIVTALIASAIWRSWNSRDLVKSRHSDALLLACCVLVVPVSMVWLLSQVWPTFVTRYLLAFSGYLYLILAWGILRVPWRWAGAVAAIFLLATMSICAGRLYGWQRERDWRPIAAYIEAEWQEGDALLLVPYANWLVFNYYADGGIPHDRDVYRQIWENYPDPPTTETLTRSLLNQPLSYERLWWIDEQGTGLAAEWGEIDPDQIVVKFLDQHFARIETPAKLNSSWGKTILYQLNSDDSTTP